MKNFYDSKHEAEMIEKLKLLEVTAPDGLWNDIDATLKAKSKRRVIIFTSWASAAGIALLFTIAGIYGIRSRVETIAVNNQKINTTIISNDKKETITTPLNTGGIKKSSINPDIKLGNNQIMIASSINSSIQYPQEIKENNVLPKPIAAIQSELKEVRIAIPGKLFIPNNSMENNYSQSLAIVDPVEKKAKGSWYLSASGFPVYSFHTSGVMDKPKSHLEVGIVSWGGSVSARYAFANRLSIETGLTYSVMGQQEKNLYLVYSDSRNNEVYGSSGISNSFGVLSVSNPDFKLMNLGNVNTLTYNAVNESNFNRVDAFQRFTYFEVPILFSKGFYYKGINFYYKGGVSAALLVRNILDLKGANIHLKGKTYGVDPFTASALTSIGVSVPIARRMNLLIEPSLKIGLKSINSVKGKSYPFSSYIKFGVEIPI